MTTDNRKVIIELRNVKRDFIVGDEKVHALRGVSFKIHEGEFVTIMGTSGSGKSTLLNQLGCLDTPTSGEYLLDGIPVRRMKRRERAVLRNRKIGFVFQNYNLLPKTTAVENVELPLMYNAAVSAREREARAVKALEMVGLGNRLHHKSNQMSGGQMQRVAIARALVNNPAVILADEATGNLDTRTSFEILVLFQQLFAYCAQHHVAYAVARRRYFGNLTNGHMGKARPARNIAVAAAHRSYFAAVFHTSVGKEKLDALPLYLVAYGVLENYLVFKLLSVAAPHALFAQCKLFFHVPCGKGEAFGQSAYFAVVPFAVGSALERKGYHFISTPRGKFCFP